MSHSVINISFYFTILLVGSTLSIQVFAEESSVSEKNILTITSDSLDVEEPDEYIDEDESEFCPDEINKQDEIEQPFFSFLDGPQEVISYGVEALARNMDEYFSNHKDYYGTSGSSLRLRLDTIFSEGGKISSISDINYVLRLPKTEKKLQIFFETTKDNDPYDVTSHAETTPAGSADKGDYVVGVQADSGEKFGWKYKPTLGGRISPRFEPFVKFKFRREDKFDKWVINWHETPHWYSTFGWGFDSYLEFNRKITNNDLFRSATFAGWRQDNDYFDLRHTLTMFHKLGNKKALSYYVGAYGKSEPKIHTTHFLVGMTYRQTIRKDYLSIELVPQIKYEKINNFRPEHSLLFRIEMMFKK